MLLCFSVWDATVPKLHSATSETKSFADGETEVSFSFVRFMFNACEFKFGVSFLPLRKIAFTFILLIVLWSKLSMLSSVICYQSSKNRAKIYPRTKNIETDGVFSSVMKFAFRKILCVNKKNVELIKKKIK